MAANPLIANYLNLQRLPVPDTQVSAIPQAPIPAPRPIAAPVLPMATAPAVTKEPDPIAQSTRNNILGHQAELQRLNETGSGISQIKNPLLRGLARVGDVAESIILPRAAALTPGTEMNHRRLVGQEQGYIDQGLGDQFQQARTNQENALTDYTQQRPDIARAGLQQKVQTARERYTADLRKKGINVTGYDEETGLPTTEDDPETMAYHQAAAETYIHEANAQKAKILADIAKNKYLPGTPEYDREMETIHRLERQQQIAMANVGMRAKDFELKAFGTVNGSPAPGSLIDDNGNTVGTAFQRNIMPTGTERNKADMAASASEQLADIKSIMQKHPTLFGPGYGKTSEFRQWIGSQDPDAQRFLAARTIAADHLAGTFGGRSEAALTALDNAIGQFKDNPQAAIAGVDQLAKANSRFEKAGTPRTNGSKSASSSGAPKAGDVVDGYRFKGGNPAVESNWEKQ